MKELFKNIFALSLACLVLLSTMSFTINSHYCGDILVSTSFITQSKSCGMDSDGFQKKEQNLLKDCSMFKKDCCTNEIQLIEGQDDLKLDFSKLNINQQVFISSFVYAYIFVLEGLDTEFYPFKYYTPPLVVKDIQLLDETFLI